MCVRKTVAIKKRENFFYLDFPFFHVLFTCAKSSLEDPNRFSPGQSRLRSSFCPLHLFNPSINLSLFQSLISSAFNADKHLNFRIVRTALKNKNETRQISLGRAKETEPLIFLLSSGPFVQPLRRLVKRGELIVRESYTWGARDFAHTNVKRRRCAACPRFLQFRLNV